MNKIKYGNFNLDVLFANEHQSDQKKTSSYPHKIDWRRLANVWYGLFKGSETLEICIYSSLAVWIQSID